MIEVENIKAFRGTMRITPIRKSVAPFELHGDWMLRDGYWYGCGRSFGEDICEVVNDETAC